MCRAVLDYAGPLDIPVVVDVRDLWPDIFLDMVPKPCAPLLRFLLRPASWANQTIFERATAIIAISEQYLGWGLLHSGRDRRDTDRVFPMGYPALSESEAERRTAEKLWVERGVKADSFVCSFIGTISRHFDFGPVIECARKMPDVQFIICGKGDDLARVQRLSHGLDNVLLPGWVDKAQIISLMKLSDVGLAPYSTKARMSLPNKVFEYFFGGLPVVSSLRGELEALLTENQCGVLYDPTNKNDLYRQLHQLVANPVGVREMGERAKRLYEDRFSSNLIYSELISYLESLARSRGGNLKLSHNSGK
jgi:glycosyltransferase involved in cell wall biosynthesis